MGDDAPRSLVMWSGGADSTMVLCHCLKEGHEVRTLSVNSVQLDAAEHQRRARAEIRRRLTGRGRDFRSTEIVTRVQRGAPAVLPGDRLAQPIMWLAAGILHLRDGEDLCLGYIRGDDVWRFWSHMTHIFDYGLDVMGKKGTLKVPLHLSTKSEILDGVRRWRLASAVWTCEEPKGRRVCGKCKPCVSKKLAQYAAKLKGK